MRLAEALERGGGVDISLLQLDAPIAELLERDGAPGDRAAHEIAGRHHLHLAVEIFQLGFALEGDVAFESIHQDRVARLCKLSVTITSSRRATPACSRLFRHDLGESAFTVASEQRALLVVAAPARSLRCGLGLARSGVGMR